jgi:hypothetical protein
MYKIQLLLHSEHSVLRRPTQPSASRNKRCSKDHAKHTEYTMWENAELFNAKLVARTAIHMYKLPVRSDMHKLLTHTLEQDLMLILAEMTAVWNSYMSITCKNKGKSYKIDITRTHSAHGNPQIWMST